MKLSTLSLSLLLVATRNSFGFQIAPGNSKVQVSSCSSTTTLQMGFFDFKPVHGSGSASENDLDEQWRRQQEILAARRGHLDKEHLKAKYKGGGGTFDVHSSMEQKMSHVDDMYIEDNSRAHQVKKKQKKSASPQFRFPWDKK